MDASHPEFEVAATRAGPELRITLKGELDLACAPVLLARVLPYADSAAEHASVVIDTAGLTFVDVAGIRALVAVSDRFAQGGREVVVRRAPYHVVRLVDLLRLHGKLCIDGEGPATS